jgi:hypothetical protein
MTAPILATPDSKVYSTPTQDYARITMLIDTLSKPALTPWSAKEERTGILALLEENGFRDSMTLLHQLGERNGKFKNGNPQYCYQRKTGDALETGGNAHDLMLNALCASQGWPSRWEVGDPGPEARNAVAAGLRFCRDHLVEPLALEELTWSDEWGIAGTMDFRGSMTWEGDRIDCILDWKTGNAIYDEMALQVAFYRLAHLERNPDHHKNIWGGIVRLPKSGEKAEVRMWNPSELDACEPAIFGLRDAWLWRESQKKNGNGKKIGGRRA